MQGFVVKDQENKVLLLNHALYGLKQAACAWWQQLSSSIKELGFTHCYSNSGIFVYTVNNGNIVIAIIYVDDSGFMGNNIELTKSKQLTFMNRWNS